MFGYERTIETVREGCAEGITTEDLVERVMSKARQFAWDEPQGGGYGLRGGAGEGMKDERKTKAQFLEELDACHGNAALGGNLVRLCYIIIYEKTMCLMPREVKCVKNSYSEAPRRDI